MAENIPSPKSFIILGHGEESIVDIHERPSIPKGYTLVTLSECGISTTKKEVCPLTEEFSKEENRILFNDPVKYKKEIETFLNNTPIHIYTAGDHYPELSIQLFLDWKKEDYVSIMKSGVYSFPISKEKFMIGEGTTFCERLFKRIGPYKETFISTTIPHDYDAMLQYDDSIFPTADTIIYQVSRKKSIKLLKKACTATLESIFTKCGPGVYYYVICRSPKRIKAPENLFELDIIHDPAYEKFKHNLNWASKVNEIIPLIKKNIAEKPNYNWTSHELKGVLKNYEMLRKVPNIRRKSLNQQAKYSTVTKRKRKGGRRRKTMKRGKN